MEDDVAYVDEDGVQYVWDSGEEDGLDYGGDEKTQKAVEDTNIYGDGEQVSCAVCPDESAGSSRQRHRDHMNSLGAILRGRSRYYNRQSFG